ncbi:hypothetical protein [Mesoterricola silvestris]|uniref:Uncharacterized protein n=1 Tax=Mesoterricola silvestris TaxID=2927979 RepID=A0AA48GPW7_9BACT|nr:hypothetical protein [Mesoterricola silvestris]BDU73934.1 hypothetical protein METEAL_31080 [Mesoterricola silvestris]
MKPFRSIDIYADRDLILITGGMFPSTQYMKPDFSFNQKAFGSALAVGAVGGGLAAAA